MMLQFSLLLVLLAASATSSGHHFRVQIATWNVNKKMASGDVTPLLGLNRAPDLVAVGLQEVTPDVVDSWTKLLDAAILPKGYSMIRTVSMAQINLSVYALKGLAAEISDVLSSEVKAGQIFPSGHKGGATISFTLRGRRIAFVGAHLTQAEKYLEDRVEDFHIIENARQNNMSQGEDYTFWMGDLNFRLMDQEKLTPEKIQEMLDNGQKDKLLKNDELNNLKRLGTVFSGYQEMKINFKPTYRFYVGNSTYDLARRPAWTDRVLYRGAPGRKITPLHYGSIPSLNNSDHKPVEAFFQISLQKKGNLQKCLKKLFSNKFASFS